MAVILNTIHTVIFVIVNACILTGASKSRSFVLPVILSQAKLFSNADVDCIQGISLSTKAHDEILLIDIAMKGAVGMHKSHSRYALIGHEEDGLERKLPAAIAKQILKRWP